MRRVVRIFVGSALAAAVLTAVTAVAAQAATAMEYGLLL